MLSTENIIDVLDNCHQNAYCNFITLGHPYTFLIDSRLNVFLKNDLWAIAGEVLGYNPRGGTINLDVFYFGNCLTDLEYYNGLQTNTAQFSPIDFDQFQSTVNGEAINTNAKSWLVRGEAVPLSHQKKDYFHAGIKLEEYEPDTVRIEEAARLSIVNYAAIFRATDDELYKSIPTDLEKILVIDEWYHKDFLYEASPYNYTELSAFAGINDPNIQDMIKLQLERENERNRWEWENNRPGSYETWIQLADVISTGNVLRYNPTMLPNSHWVNWPESGSL